MLPDLRELISAASTGLYERETLLRLGLLAALAGESIFFLGPPGTGKSLVARRLKAMFKDATSFEYLMGRFSTPDEIFGPVSVKKLSEEGIYERQTRGYMPDAEIVFLDEVWNASPPIQNALLTAMNEKLFRNGSQEVPVKMTLLIGASNSLHPGEETAAFWDRFLIRVPVQPILNEEHVALFLGDSLSALPDPVPAGKKISQADSEKLRRLADNVDLPSHVLAVLTAVRSRQAERQTPSDRRWKKIAGLVRVSAAARGKAVAGLPDLAVLEYCLWEDPEDRHELRLWVRDAVQGVIRREAGHLATAVEKLERGLGTLVEAIVQAGGEEILQPAIFDGEYYALRLDAGERVFRVWKPDGDAMLRARCTVELFGFEKGALTGSTMCEAEPLAESWKVRISFPGGDEQTAVIVTAKTKVVSAGGGRGAGARDLLQAAGRAAEIPAGHRAQFASEIEKIAAEIEAAGAELGKLSERFEDDFESQVFLAPGQVQTEAWFEPLEELGTRLEIARRAAAALRTREQ